MSSVKQARLDWFRVVCAVLVVAIHTSPLETLSPDADWMFTRVFARIAVPFFFLSTGYFSVQPLKHGSIGRSLQKLLLLYGAAIILYLPLNLYIGDLDTLSPLSLLRDLLLDGTFYHLWYFPAVILGLALLRTAVKFLGWNKAGILVFALYAVGLGGDSWHGLAVMLPGVDRVYDALFQWMDYTRNGLFFAPVYLWLGGTLNGKHPDRGACMVGLLLSFCALLSEAALLRYSWLSRFDSMYLSLIPVSVCLFSLLVSATTGSRKDLRIFSLLVYILHPWCIVVLRFIARPLGLWKWLVDDRLIAFLAVCALTGLLSAAGTLFWKKYKS